MRLYYWSQLSPTFQKSGKFAHVSIIFSSGCSSGGKPIWVAFYSSRTRRHRFPSLFFLHDWFVQIDESCFSRYYRVVSTMVAFLFLLTTQWSHQILLCSLQMAGFQKYLLMVFYTPHGLQVWSWEKDLPINLWPPPRDLAGLQIAVQDWRKILMPHFFVAILVH